MLFGLKLDFCTSDGEISSRGLPTYFDFGKCHVFLKTFSSVGFYMEIK